MEWGLCVWGHRPNRPMAVVRAHVMGVGRGLSPCHLTLGVNWPAALMELPDNFHILIVAHLSPSGLWGEGSWVWTLP